jgi:hypothetical protein
VDKVIEYSFSSAVTAVPVTAEELPEPADADVVPAPPPPPLDEQPARNATASTDADAETALITNPAMTKLLCIMILPARSAPNRADSTAVACREGDRPARSSGSSSRRIEPWG